MKILRGLPWIVVVSMLATTISPKALSARDGGLPHSVAVAAANDDGRDGHRPVNIILEEVAVSAWDDGVSVGTQLQLQNIGQGTAPDLRVTRVEVTGGTYQGPATLPTSLGDLAAGEDKLLDVVLKVAAADGSPRTLTVEGDYSQGLTRRPFRTQWSISPNALPPGPFSSTPGQTVKQNPNSVVYPPEPPPATFGPNAESPVFVPLGPPRQLFAPTPTGTTLGTSAGSALVQIPRNTSMRSAGVPPDPNAASMGTDKLVLATYNTGISYSIDGGQSFTDTVGEFGKAYKTLK